MRWNTSSGEEGGDFCVKRGHCLIPKNLHFGNAFHQIVSTSYIFTQNHNYKPSLWFLYGFICSFKWAIIFDSAPQNLTFWFSVNWDFFSQNALLCITFNLTAELHMKPGLAYCRSIFCLSLSVSIHELCYLSPNFQHDLWRNHLTRTIALTSAWRPSLSGFTDTMWDLIKLQLWDDKCAHCLTLWTGFGHVPLSHENWVSHFSRTSLYPFAIQKKKKEKKDFYLMPPSEIGWKN